MPSRECSRGHHDKPVSGVCPRCLEATYGAEYEPPEPHMLWAAPESKGSDYFPDRSEQE